jgi:hypothetical protein
MRRAVEFLVKGNYDGFAETCAGQIQRLDFFERASLTSCTSTAMQIPPRIPWIH